MIRSQVALLVAICVCSLVTANPAKQQPSDVNFCQGCRALMSFTQTFNSTNHRAEYKDIFKNFCEFYYPVSTDFQQGPCPLFVQGLYSVLDLMDPVHHCDQIGACGSTKGVKYSLLPERLPAKQADVICKFCEQSVEQVQTALSDPATIDQVRRQADQLCDYFKVVDADKECREVMNKYLDKAIKFIQEMDPLTYCRSIQLCSAQARPLAKKSGASNSRVLNSAPTRQLPTLADFSDFGLETSVVIGAKPTTITTILPKKHISPGCMICKTFVKEMFHFLRDNKTEANIVRGLGEVCQELFSPGEKLDQCQSMVNAYTRELIQLLIDETDPDMICVLLEQCLSAAPASNKASMPPMQQAKAVASIAASDTPRRSLDLGDLIHSLDPTVRLRSAKGCFECKMFIKYLRNTFDEPRSRETIKNWLLENLCNSIPEKNTRDQCTNLVNEYADTFFAAVIGSLNPSTACTELGACTRKTLSEVLQIDTLASFEQPEGLPSFIVSPKPKQQQVMPPGQTRPMKVRGQMCDQCVQIISQIDEYLASHPIDKDVSVLIDQVCNKLPGDSVRSECTYLIDTFGTEIAQAISTMDNPRQLCSKFMLC